MVSLLSGRIRYACPEVISRAYSGMTKERRAFEYQKVTKCVNGRRSWRLDTGACSLLQSAILLTRRRCTSVASETEESNIRQSGQKGHIPVMLNEVLAIINPKKGQRILDMTFGGGGHSLSMIRQCPEVEVYALDRDVSAHNEAVKTAHHWPQLHPVHGKFSEVHKLLAQEDIGPGSMDAILFDVGASSMQFDQADRGFSLSHQGPLDMRMDQSSSLKASDAINNLNEEELHRIIKKYGEERMARPIARAIVDSRNSFGYITTTSQLANVIASVFQGDHKHDKLMRHSHVGTKTFQALRIFVNDELNELNNGLKLSSRLLRPGGVCVAVTFHSLEDRIVKRHFHGIAMDDKETENMLNSYSSRDSSKTFGVEQMDRMIKNTWKPLTKKVIQPSQQEIDRNPRSRSARLRAAMKI